MKTILAHLLPFLGDLLGPPERRRTLRTALRTQVLPTLLLTSVLAALYVLSRLIEPGLATYAMSAVPLVIIWLTAVARVNDITEPGRQWHVRRLGLVLCGAACVALLMAPLFPSSDFPSWSEVYIRWGFALTWLTTPNMPPWTRYVFGGMPERRSEPREKQL